MTEAQAESGREKRARVAALVRRDPHAPLYHFIAPEGGCVPFDPNGAIFWKGRYHLFYIFQDAALPHGGHCWGHASSTDLVHWTFHPTALAPARGDPDLGIFSGCAFVNPEGVPTIVYHGVGAGTCTATAQDDGLIRWLKSAHNPVIPEPKEGADGWGVYNVFDPHVWVEGDTCYAILGGRVKPHDIRDTAYLFRSRDMVRWQYVQPFYSPHPRWTDEGEDCACPDFFQLGDRHVLMCISHPRGARYYVGRYQMGTFIPEEHHRMNWPGGPCFATESLLDDRGRRIFWAWALDQRRGYLQGALGVMTMPRVLSLAHDGSVRIEPPREIETLRRNYRRVEGLVLAADSEVPIEGIEGDSLELALEADVPAHGQFGLKVRVAPDGSEQTAIICDVRAKALSVDSARSSLNPDVWRPFPISSWVGAEQKDVPVQEAPLELRPGEPLALRVFLDRSVLEVFANGRQCLTQRIYPARADSVAVTVYSRGGPARVRWLDAWEITPTNTE